MTTDTKYPDNIRGVETMDDVWLSAREQIAFKLKEGVISQSGAEFSERLIVAVKTLVEDNGLHIADAVVFMSVAGTLMALAAGAIDAHADKETRLAESYMVEAMHVMAVVARNSARYKQDGGKITFSDGTVRTGDPTAGSTKASFEDFISDLDAPPAGELN